MTLAVRQLGRVEYTDGLELQRQLQEARRAGEISDTLLLLEHPPVLTLGRGAKAENVLFSREALRQSGVEVFETDRGGDVTYHGPGQLVGYPLLHLPPGKQDVRKYVRNLEEVLIRTLAGFGITAHREQKWPGVWVADSKAGGLRKIAALGVHLSRWYTRHGFALNIAPNLKHFDFIVPCGIKEAGVTSMQVELGTIPNGVEPVLIKNFADVFETEPILTPPERRTIQVVVHDGPKVLLFRRIESGGGFWQPITGSIEPGETAADAAARELLEESGFSTALRPLGYQHSFAIAGQVFEETAFATQATMNPRIDSREHDLFEWVSREEALNRVPHPGLREAIRRATA